MKLRGRRRIENSYRRIREEIGDTGSRQGPMHERQSTNEMTSRTLCDLQQNTNYTPEEVWWHEINQGKKTKGIVEGNGESEEMHQWMEVSLIIKRRKGCLFFDNCKIFSLPRRYYKELRTNPDSLELDSVSKTRMQWVMLKSSGGKIEVQHPLLPLLVPHSLRSPDIADLSWDKWYV